MPHWTKALTLTYQCFTAVLLIYGSLFLSGIYFPELFRQVQVQDASFPVFPHRYVHILPLVVKFDNLKRW